MSALDDLIGTLSGVEGFNEGVTALRERRMAPAVTPPPAPTDDPFSVDATMKAGNREARAAMVDQYGVFPKEPSGLDSDIATREGLHLPGWEKRLEQLGQEVKVEKKAGGFLGTLKSTLDIAGKVLDAPAESLEKTIGMAYWNEVPMSDRWEMSRWTYDSIWADIFGGGGGGKSQAMLDYEAGKSWEQIESENEHVLGNTLAHLVLDPMWLVGGVPLVGKLPGPAAAAVGHGLDFSKVPLLKAVPGVRRIGQAPGAQRLDDSVGILEDMRGTESFNVNRTKGGLRRLFQKNPQAHVDDNYTDITNITSALSDPNLWSGGAVRQMFTDLTRGTLTRSGMLGLENTTPVKRLRTLFSENPGLNESIQRFESLNPISANAFWDDAKHVLVTMHDGQKTTIPDLVARGAALTAEEYQRLGTYRSVKFLEEFHEKGLPSLWDIHKLPKKDLLAHADSLSGAMKTWLSMFTINTPGFVVMNFANNAAMIAMKGDDIVGSAAFAERALSPLSWFGRPALSTGRRSKLATEMGFDTPLVSGLADDSAFYSEMAGGTADDLIKGPSRARRLADKALPFVRVAAKVDDGMRETVTQKAIVDASAAVWHTGPGGVRPALSDAAKSVPGFEDWVDGLKFKGFGEVEDMARRFGIAHSDEFIDAQGMLTAWARQAAPGKFPEAGGAEEISRFLEASFPDGALQHLDDFIIQARQARRAGDPDYLSGLSDQVDNWHDELYLKIEDMRLADHLAPQPLPYRQVREHLVPWHDVAEFSRLQRARQELVTRMVAANNPAFGGEAGAKLVQDGIRSHMAEYETKVRDLWLSAPKNLSSANQRRLTQAQGELLTIRNRRISRLFESNPDMRRQWNNMARVEREHLTEAMDIRVASMDSLAGIPAGSTRAAQWGQTIERAHKAEAAAVERAWKAQGFEYSARYVEPEYPTSAELMGSMADDVHKFLDFARTDLPNRFRTSNVLTAEQIGAMSELGPELMTAMRQRNLVASHHGRSMRDFVALNYAQKRGFDGVLALVFPYHFWLGRTAKDWMRLSAYRPGQTAALGRMFHAVRDINEDAGIPDRLKGQIRIPIPFLDQQLFGETASIYFDPLRLVNPLTGFQQLAEDGARDSDAGTKAGKVFEFASNLGFGINPFMTLGLGSIGALGDRHAYVQRGLASVNSLPFGFPGPRVFRSASDWLAGVSEDPDPEYLTPEIKQLLADGEPLPENVLKEAFQGIADIATTDGFDGYRTDRMVANLVGSDPERWSARDGLEALKYRRGPLWNEADRLAKKEKGLRVLTGWGFMPMSVYPEGEEVQRGLDAIWREVRDKDDPAESDKFFAQHPEYQVRRISLLDREDPAGQQGELDTALFYLDLDQVEKKFGQTIDLIRDNIRRMEEAGYLETKEGRRLRAVAQNDVGQLTDLRQAELDQLDALYPNRSKDLSLRASPHERGLYELREQFYGIRRSNFKTDEEFYAARTAFVERIPAEGAQPGEWMQSAVQAIAIWNRASDEAGERPALAGEIIAARDQRLRKLTEDNVGRISREDFQRYLSKNGKPPTANAIEYQKAKAEIAAYSAIGEAPGLSDASIKAYRKEYWQTHPLLNKYYGRDEPKAWNAESAQTYGRMDQIWDGFYAVEGDARAQRDYLGGNLAELNELRISVGLFPIRLTTKSDIPALGTGGDVFTRPDGSRVGDDISKGA